MDIYYSVILFFSHKVVNYKTMVTRISKYLCAILVLLLITLAVFIVNCMSKTALSTKILF